MRDAWIGVEIPLLVEEPVSTFGFGVLTGPKNIALDWFLGLIGRAKPVAGYVVAADTAVACLMERAPAAADWWRTEVPLSDRARGSSSMRYPLNGFPRPPDPP